MGRSTKRRVISKHIANARPGVVLIQETKLGSHREKMIDSWAKALGMQYCLVPATGSAGGLLNLWRENVLEVIQVITDQRFIVMLAKLQNVEELVLVVNVYGPHSDAERFTLFVQLLTILTEHKGGTIMGADSCLVDLPLHRGHFTWSSTRNDGLGSRLDRWLLSEDMFLCFNNFNQFALEWGISDHRAVGLSFGLDDYGPKPFNFFNHWLLEDGFNELVEGWWNSLVVEGWGGFVLMKKLKDLKRKINEWRKGRGIWGVQRIRELEEKVHWLMARMETEGSTKELRLERIAIMGDLWKEYRAEEATWIQKSRLRWAREGDRNTRFFHRVCKVRTAKKSISQLRVEDRLLEEPQQVKEAIMNHFKSFFSHVASERPSIQCYSLKKVTAGQNRFLEAEFTTEEVFEAIQNFDANKAPGPDGFTMAFFKQFWSLIKEDVMRFFGDFHVNGKIVKGLNAAFIALIPKGNNQETVADYRPISLIGGIYKLLAKVLANRLSEIMPSVLTQNQFAFTKGRQIVDCCFIANEVVDTMRRNEGGGLLMKLDFAKAYDNVEWGFLLDMMKEMGFGEKWRIWMHSCVSTATLAVLVNGSPTDFFQIQKGLRQGDPLSPLLFNLCVNGMSCLLNQALDGSIPSGVDIGKGLRLNHLQFADDALLFCEGDLRQVKRLALTLEAFLFVSGLKVNFRKSSLIGVNVGQVLEEQAASMIGFNREQLPFVYLGLPLGGSPKKGAFWKPVVDQMSARAPKGVIGEMEAKMRRFLWGGSVGNRKISWVAWEDLCKGVRYGGMGLGFLEWKNKALLLKWFWRFGRERDALWRRLVCAKYGLMEQYIMLNLEGVSVNSGSCITRDLLGLWREQTVGVNEFINGLACKVGDGMGVRFWDDVWVGEIALRTMFPRIYAMSTQKKSAVAEVGNRVGGRWEWMLEFRRGFFQWELEHYNMLQQLIHSVVPVGTSDNLFWKGDSMGIYTVKGLCCMLEDKWFCEAGWVVPRMVRKLVPTKVCTFMWQLQKNRVATKANLMRRGIVLPDDGCCVLCFAEMETTEHLFLHCNLIWPSWVSILRREGVYWAMPHKLADLLMEWGDLRRISDRVLWDMIPYAFVWTVWLERNGVVFNNKDFCIDTVWDMHIARMSWWVKAWWRKCPYTAAQFAVGMQHIVLPKPVKIRKQLQWVAPAESILKFNVDGSTLDSPGQSGIGGVLRNHDGVAVGYFALKVGEMWAYEAEVLAIYQALLFCQQFNFKTVVIESDSTLAVGWVGNSDRRPWKLYQILSKIDWLISEVNCLGVVHVLREANEVADFLAKSGRDGRVTLWQITLSPSAFWTCNLWYLLDLVK
ncbi:uncharacterized protein LOC130722016 [Lotus japonicus]|uniref:uncharacterized protein LOC130722016 n=1 Tax=Lotus japonicus TaxID=34305 RepID=UPI0025840E18|nr:uncharacterized protein LOC130722016 [Lotus japonicus]